MSIAFLFPGQGSQTVGMGAEVFSRYPDLLSQADNELGYSLSQLCLQDEDNQLGQTQFTQPALYVTSFLEARAKIDDGILPSLAAGHSVGEFPALAIAGCFSFLDGLRMVAKRGEIMSCITGGGMAAVIGLDTEKIREITEQVGANQVDLANFNSPGQVVISGPAAEIQTTLGPLKEAGARMVIPLKVSGAFHSRMMEKPAREFGEFIKEIKFTTPEIPIYSNVDAKHYTNADEIPPLLVRQIHSSVRWSDVITQMRADGADDFFECGPGNVLSKLLRQIP